LAPTEGEVGRLAIRRAGCCAYRTYSVLMMEKNKNTNPLFLRLDRGTN